MLVVLAVVAAIAITGAITAPSGSASSRYDGDINATIADIQAYWTKTMPEVYQQDYEPIPADRLIPYSQSNPPPSCGGRGTTPYTEVAGNAFYCSQGDFVAWDEQELLPKLRKQFGNFAPALVLAHEWGHAIQARVGFDTYQTIYLEQQADCFAGAWTAHVASGDASVQMNDEDLDGALAGLLQLRDPSGIDGSQDGAHGNGFDRVGAFQDGYEGGAETCAAYQNNPPSITESGYTSEADYASGGDMSLADVLPAVTDSLSSYWGKDRAEGGRLQRRRRSVVRRRHRRRRPRRQRHLLPVEQHDQLRTLDDDQRARLDRRLRIGRAARGRVVVGGAGREGPAARNHRGSQDGRLHDGRVHREPRRQLESLRPRQHHAVARRPRRGRVDARGRQQPRRRPRHCVQQGLGVPHGLLPRGRRL